MTPFPECRRSQSILRSIDGRGEEEENQLYDLSVPRSYSDYTGMPSLLIWRKKVSIKPQSFALARNRYSWLEVIRSSAVLRFTVFQQYDRCSDVLGVFFYSRGEREWVRMLTFCTFSYLDWEHILGGKILPFKIHLAGSLYIANYLAFLQSWLFAAPKLRMLCFSHKVGRFEFESIVSRLNCNFSGLYWPVSKKNAGLSNSSAYIYLL